MKGRGIAIVGAGCVLPGALDPDELWELVVAGRSGLTRATSEAWGVPPESVLGSTALPALDRAHTDIGGYVLGFDERFDPTKYGLSRQAAAELPRIDRWAAYAAGEALAGVRVSERERQRCALVLGNLSYPTLEAHDFIARHHLGDALSDAVGLPRTSPSDRFCSGLVAERAARRLGLGGRAFCVDAACASALYALRIACDLLQRGEVDVAIAGAVNAADDLFLHVGFTALRALSPSGRSRPFHSDADGLIPAEGAVALALKRLEDAVAAGDVILGVVRAVGLSNDGFSGGFLTPRKAGQLAAMRRAYAASGLAPGDVSLLECHATGTSVGDAVEVESAVECFCGAEEIPFGSLKSNLGHLITAAGGAAIIKVLQALRHGIRPKTLHTDAPLARIRAPLRLLRENESWRSARLPCAAVSAFGFGGNNAHAIIEAYEPDRSFGPVPNQISKNADAVVITLWHVFAPGASDVQGFSERLFGEPGTFQSTLEDLTIALEGLRFPPSDLDHTLGQQLAVMELVRRMLSAHSLPERTSVLVGMGADATIGRFAVRLRADAWVERLGSKGADPGQSWASAFKSVAAPAPTAADVLGTMPNMPANRSNQQLGLTGPSLTLASEELSGLDAVLLAAGWLEDGEIDAAIVAAVDLSAEPAHADALRKLCPEGAPPGDGAVALLMERAEDAERAGRPVLALLADPNAYSEETLVSRAGGADSALSRRFGHAHAASGLLNFLALSLAARGRRSVPQSDRAAPPALRAAGAIMALEATSLDGARRRIAMRAVSRAMPVGRPPCTLFLAASSRRELQDALMSPVGSLSSAQGRHRVALHAGSSKALAALRARAARWLEGAQASSLCRVEDGCFYAGEAVQGEVALVFNGAAAAYAGMGTSLLAALPALGDAVVGRHGTLARARAWLDPHAPPFPTPFDYLLGSTLLCQLHAELSVRLLGLRPNAVLGISSGETNAMFALGAWDDVDAMFEEIAASRMYDEQITGRHAAVRAALGLVASAPLDWRCYRVLESPETIERLVGPAARVFLTMINAPRDAIIAGFATDCERALAALPDDRWFPLGHDVLAHSSLLESWKEPWFALHQRRTRELPGVRYYANATSSVVPWESAAIAQALTLQAIRRVDFRSVVEAAYADGVRIFVEHGPRALASGWIDEILGDRPHLALALDRPHRALSTALDTISQLFCAGVAIDVSALESALEVDDSKPQPGPSKRVALHWPPFTVPPLPVAEPSEIMARAPRLPSAIAASVDLPISHTESARSVNIASIALEQYCTAAQLHRQFLELQARGLPLFLRRTDEAEAAPSRAGPRGPSFDRATLEAHASGRISAIFGPEFLSQDNYLRQVRMPAPPLLLADRIVGIDAAPASMSDSGIVWTETDVVGDAWYLHHGHMPLGVVIEAGQADLFLISFLGVDLENRGERVYRLLGCELVFRGGLPRAGERLRYEIHLDGYALQGSIRLFFFRYQCWAGERLLLEVTRGQAGFFSDAELAESGGVLFRPEESERALGSAFTLPDGALPAGAFDDDAVSAFFCGRAWQAFGDALRRCASHSRTPSVSGGKMALFDRIPAYDPRGGPWRRGYLRAELDIHADAWFFDGHFMNDPCMPGTLMLEGGAEVMAFYVTALGLTRDRDGSRFEPVTDEAFLLRCRGQVTPRSKRVIYELFVRSIELGREPVLRADLLCTVDGLAAFHGERIALKLVLDWPLAARISLDPALVTNAQRSHDSRLPATVDGNTYDAWNLLACAWGRPSEAFGPRYTEFDDGRRGPRLPSPPFHFVSRVVEVEARAGALEPGGRIVAEYDIPESAWYFAESGSGNMPLSVLLEVALQPCGWLATYIGGGFSDGEESFFRNLDGTLTPYAEVTPSATMIRTHVKNTSVSRAGPLIVVGFDVRCEVDSRSVLDVTTVFGFFPAAALREQVGLPPENTDQSHSSGVSAMGFDLAARPARYFSREARLNGPMLGSIERVTELWPAGGAKGLGRLRTEMDVDPEAWFFEAHFFGDPVMPGSLGLEFLNQTLALFALESGVCDARSCRLRPLAPNTPLVWKYRGQVVPEATRIVADVELVERRDATNGTTFVARGTLLVDGKRIYEAQGLSLHVASSSVRTPSFTVGSPGAAIELLVAAARARMPGRLWLGLEQCRFEAGFEFSEAELTGYCHARPLDRRRARAELFVWNGQRGVHECIAQSDVLFGEDYGLGPRALREARQRPLSARSTAELFDAIFASFAANSQICARFFCRWPEEGSFEARWTQSEVGAFRDVQLVSNNRVWATIVLGETQPRRVGALPELSSATAFVRAVERVGPSLLEDLLEGLSDRFVERVIAEQGFENARGRSVLYLANHQVAIESFVACFLLSGVSGVRTRALAKEEHRVSRLGRMVLSGLERIGPRAPPPPVLFVDRARPEQVLEVLSRAAAESSTSPQSLLVHIEGTRSLSCGKAPTTLSAALLDLADAFGLPVVPVRFAGGLPTTRATQRLDFPAGYGKQFLYLGNPIEPEALRDKSLSERRALVLDRLQALGPPWATERPSVADMGFYDHIIELRQRGLSESSAVLVQCLVDRRLSLSPDGATVLAAVERLLGGTAPSTSESSLAALTDVLGIDVQLVSI